MTWQAFSATKVSGVIFTNGSTTKLSVMALRSRMGQEASAALGGLRSFIILPIRSVVILETPWTTWVPMKGLTKLVNFFEGEEWVWPSLPRERLKYLLSHLWQ